MLVEETGGWDSLVSGKNVPLSIAFHTLLSPFSQQINNDENKQFNINKQAKRIMWTTLNNNSKWKYSIYKSCYYYFWVALR